MASMGGLISKFVIINQLRGVAQLVARTAGGREAIGSSPITPTKFWDLACLDIRTWLEDTRTDLFCLCIIAVSANEFDEIRALSDHPDQ